MAVTSASATSQPTSGPPVTGPHRIAASSTPAASEVRYAVRATPNSAATRAACNRSSPSRSSKIMGELTYGGGTRRWEFSTALLSLAMAPTGGAPGATGDSGDPLYLDQAVVEGRRPAQVRDALRGDVVGVAAVGRVLLPPHRGRHHDAAARLVVDARLQHEAAALVVHPHPVAAG